MHATFPLTRRVFDFSQASINFEDPEGYFELEGRVEIGRGTCDIL
jgi:4'-phosphopantetheinyl transferase EntD